MNAGLKKLLHEIKLVVFDFDGVFTNNHVVVSEDGSESVVCNRSDGFGLRRLEEMKVQAFILSSEINNAVVQRARKIQIQCFAGVNDKLALLKTEVKRRKLSLGAVAFMGNDINDIDCLKTVGFPVVVADAWPEVVPYAKLVLKRKGGEGAVREFCDLIWASRRKSG
jgi:3-deoxy-D-manno-octulosonate 8-phosphate phosphatase (KDO 8-P phosphatase)